MVQEEAYWPVDFFIMEVTWHQASMSTEETNQLVLNVMQEWAFRGLYWSTHWPAIVSKIDGVFFSILKT